MTSTTSKPISCICYLHKNVLQNKLEELVKEQKILIYDFIEHKGELNKDTNEREKNHIHLYLEPFGKIDIKSLVNFLVEVDKDNVKKMLGCVGFKVCNSRVDWLYYSIHDKEYLIKKNLTREFRYSFKDIITNDYEELVNFLNDNERPYSVVNKVQQDLLSGLSVNKIALSMVHTTKDLAYLNTIRKNIYTISEELFAKEEQYTNLEEEKEKALTTGNSQGNSCKTTYETMQENKEVTSSIQQDVNNYFKEKQEKEANEIYFKEKEKQDAHSNYLELQEIKRKEEEEKTQSTIFYEEIFKKKTN